MTRINDILRTRIITTEDPFELARDLQSLLRSQPVLVRLDDGIWTHLCVYCQYLTETENDDSKTEHADDCVWGNLREKWLA